MTLPTLVLGRLSASRAADVLERAERAELTYGPIGGTFDTGPSEADLHMERVLGAGGGDFAAAVECYRALGSQRSVAGVWPEDATAELGATILISLRFGPVTVLAVDRIVAIIDEPRRWAFAYGTLPGHAEVGEEAFIVEHRPDDTVVAKVVAIAHVALPGARFLQPLLVPIQRRFARRYLDAVAAAVESARA